MRGSGHTDSARYLDSPVCRKMKLAHSDCQCSGEICVGGHVHTPHTASRIESHRAAGAIHIESHVGSVSVCDSAGDS